MYFSGDVPQHRLGETNQIRLREAYAARAKQLATRHGLMFVMVGRPGLMGSSGFHLLGGRRDEAHVIAAAIDALKSKLSINRLALAGQSGGARIIAQLMVMGRRDIACAAMASGAYGLPRLKGGGTTRTNLFGKPAQRYLVPLRNTDRIVPDSTRRSFVIGDPKDAVTPFGEQREWANMLTASRHHAVLIEAKGAGPEHHGLSAGALEAAALCAKGRPDSEIIDAVRRAG
jgi:pimeloyl-ACP methyl ester carboxylesterase